MPGRDQGLLIDRLTEVLGGPLSDLGLDLEQLSVTPAGKRRLLRVAVDKDGGLTLDDVAEATKEISTLLDADGLMGEQPYTLEVSSPGVDRPLTLPRHWRRNVDRLVTVTLVATEGGTAESVTGRIHASDEDGAEIEVDGSSRRIDFARVERARVQVEFSPKSRARADSEEA